MNLDKYFLKKYNSKTYNCAHLVVDVWKEVTGQDITKILGTFLAGEEDRDASKMGREWMIPIENPIDPCFVIFRLSKVAPHCGMYLRKRVLHITPKGVYFQPLEVIAFYYPRRRFYQLCP